MLSRAYGLFSHCQSRTYSVLKPRTAFHAYRELQTPLRQCSLRPSAGPPSAAPIGVRRLQIVQLPGSHRELHPFSAEQVRIQHLTVETRLTARLPQMANRWLNNCQQRSRLRNHSLTRSRQPGRRRTARTASPSWIDSSAWYAFGQAERSPVQNGRSFRRIKRPRSAC